MALELKHINVQTCAPISLIDTGSPYNFPAKGIALCLSGGGYRAMLFHLGSLWRLNEIGYLKKLTRISSVSGGSIIAAMLGLKWGKLAFDTQGVGRQFIPEIVEPIRMLAGKTIDIGAIIIGIIGPCSVSSRLTKAYKEYLFGKATLEDLPDSPRFVINATNVQSGALWRFMKPYMRDYKVGEVKNPKIDLATVVAASSAFPPFLSPTKLKLNSSDFTPNSGKLQREPFTTDIMLTDGGVYDNLGLETAWKRYDTIWVSDGGACLKPEANPKVDWARQLYRILNLIDNEVVSLRKRQVIDSFKLRNKMIREKADQNSDLFKLTTREGTYWGVRTNIEDYKLADALPCPFEKTLELANEPTRLKSINSDIQERLINWGYAVCDAAMRKHVDNTLLKPLTFPYLRGVN